MTGFHPFTEGGKVVETQRRRRLVRGLQQPRLQFRVDFESFHLLLANGADQGIHELLGCGADTGTNLIPQEFFHVLIRRYFHD